MDNSIYVALSKQAVQFRKMDVVANNVANVNTPSFKRDVMMLTEWNHPDVDREKVAFAQDLRMYRKHEPGPIKRTGNNLDVAISGDAFFTVETAFGNRYTRNGQFQLDAQGTLVTPEGYPVLDNNGGRIFIPEDVANIGINEDGSIALDEALEFELGIVSFANNQDLSREGDSLYRSNAEPIPGGDFRLMQGFLESSNVQSVTEITDMIKTARSISKTSGFMDTAYELQRRAMNAWAQEGNQ